MKPEFSSSRQVGTIPVTDTPLERHRVALVLFVDAEGINRRDAINRAEDVVRIALVREMDARRHITITDRFGITHTADLHKVIEIGDATLGGYLRLEPTDRAYPRNDEPEENSGA